MISCKLKEESTFPWSLCSMAHKIIIICVITSVILKWEQTLSTFYVGVFISLGGFSFTSLSLSLSLSSDTILTLWWHRCFSIGWKYGMVVSLHLLGKSLKMSRNIFLKSFYKLRNKRHTSSSSLRQDHFPLRLWSWEELFSKYLRF